MSTRFFHAFRAAALAASSAVLIAADTDSNPSATARQPTSPAALAIIKKHDKSVDDAEKIFDQAKKKADADAVKQLKLVERDAMRGGNLAEAEAIEATCKSWSDDSQALAGDARQLIGAWAFGNNKWLIAPSAVKHPDGDTAKPTFQGGSCIVKWGTGSIDRFTPLADGLILHEGWSKDHRAGVDVPDWIEEGKKAGQ